MQTNFERPLVKYGTSILREVFDEINSVYFHMTVKCLTKWDISAFQISNLIIGWKLKQKYRGWWFIDLDFFLSGHEVFWH